MSFLGGASGLENVDFRFNFVGFVRNSFLEWLTWAGFWGHGRRYCCSDAPWLCCSVGARLDGCHLAAFVSTMLVGNLVFSRRRCLQHDLGACAAVLPSAVLVLTWLILPVVICLSQRLSHACLSISFNTVKLRMAH